MSVLIEHVPAKCTHFADKNMLQHIDPGALSYRRNGSISTESAAKEGREKESIEAVTPGGIGRWSWSFNPRCEPFRGNKAVTPPDHSRHFVPIGVPIQSHADPPFVTDIRWHEEPFWVRANQHHLAPRRRFAPHRGSAVTTLLHSENLVAHAKGRIAPSLFLSGFGKNKADCTKSIDRLWHGTPI
jgi:hypothetical protein